MACVTMGVWKYKLNFESSAVKLGDIEIDHRSGMFWNADEAFIDLAFFLKVHGFNDWRINCNCQHALAQKVIAGEVWYIDVKEFKPMAYLSKNESGHLGSYEHAEKMEKEHLNLYGGSHDGE